jgi:hypothetical protein
VFQHSFGPAAKLLLCNKSLWAANAAQNLSGRPSVAKIGRKETLRNARFSERLAAYGGIFPPHWGAPMDNCG